jgi:tetratricopeptide (TPR) repeat protein
MAVGGLVVALLILTGDKAKSDLEKATRTARTAMVEGDFGKAKRTLQRAIDEFPDRSDRKNLLAEPLRVLDEATTKLAQKRSQDAQGQQKQGRDQSARIALSNIKSLVAQRDLELARRMTVRAMEEYAGTSVSNEFADLLHAIDQEMEQARQALARTAAQKQAARERHEALRNQGVVAMTRKDFHAAIDAFEKALREEDDPDTRRLLAEALDKTSNPRLAVVEFKVLGEVGGTEVGKSLAELLVAKFGQDRFQLIERMQIATLLLEKDLAIAEIVDNPKLVRSKGFQGVRYLVLGTVSRVGNLTISARLVDVATGDVVQTADSCADDLLGLQQTLEELALVLQMTPEEKKAHLEKKREELLAKARRAKEDRDFDEARTDYQRVLYIQTAPEVSSELAQVDQAVARLVTGGLEKPSAPTKAGPQSPFEANAMAILDEAKSLAASSGSLRNSLEQAIQQLQQSVKNDRNDSGKLASIRTKQKELLDATQADPAIVRDCLFVTRELADRGDVEGVKQLSLKAVDILNRIRVADVRDLNTQVDIAEWYAALGDFGAAKRMAGSIRESHSRGEAHRRIVCEFVRLGRMQEALDMTTVWPSGDYAGDPAVPDSKLGAYEVIAEGAAGLGLVDICQECRRRAEELLAAMPLRTFRTPDRSQVSFDYLVARAEGKAGHIDVCRRAANDLADGNHIDFYKLLELRLLCGDYEAALRDYEAAALRVAGRDDYLISWCLSRIGEAYASVHDPSNIRTWMGNSNLSPGERAMLLVGAAKGLLARKDRLMAQAVQAPPGAPQKAKTSKEAIGNIRKALENRDKPLYETTVYYGENSNGVAGDMFDVEVAMLGFTKDMEKAYGKDAASVVLKGTPFASETMLADVANMEVKEEGDKATATDLKGGVPMPLIRKDGGWMVDVSAQMPKDAAELSKMIAMAQATVKAINQIRARIGNSSMTKEKVMADLMAAMRQAASDHSSVASALPLQFSEPTPPPSEAKEVIASVARSLAAARRATPQQATMRQALYGAARELMEAYVRAHPDDAEIRPLLADLLLTNLGDPAAAQKVAEDLLAQRPKSADGLWLKGQCMKARAQAGYEKLLEQAAQSPDARATTWAHYGLELLSQGRPTDAEAYLNKAYQAGAKDAASLSALARIAAKQKQFKEAEQYLVQAVRDEGAEPATWLMLASIQKSNGKLEEAETSAHEAIRHLPPVTSPTYQGPNKGDMLLVLGQVLVLRSRVAEAADAFVEAAKYPFARPMATLQAAQCCYLLGRYSQAQEFIDEASKLLPGDTAVADWKRKIEDAHLPRPGSATSGTSVK